LVISVPANNRIYYFDVRISPIHKEGRRAGRLIVWRDITQVKETELALEASLRRTESLYEVAESVSGIVPLDELFEVVVEKVAAALPADRVTLIVFDQAAEQITNFVAGGPGLAEVKRVSYGELMEGLSGWVLRQRRPTLSVKGEPDTRESADVQRRRLETNAGSIIVVPILYRERILGTITAIKRPEEPDFEEADVDLLEAMANQVAVAIENYQLYEAQVEQVAELKESNDALQAFSHMVAHDLKGPLSVMIGYGEILLGNSGAVQIPDSELRHYASIIYGTSRKMSTIINDLLLLARIRRQEEAPLKGLDMVTILEEVLGRLEFEIEQAEAKIYYPDVWPEVVGYGPWVEEIWVNYITNALKYGGEEPKVELGWDRAVEGDIRFWVRDWGMGISTGEQEKLFVEFSRVEERKIKGYGLGLSIVRRVVERMGGMAGVESELGAGSRFWFTLREKNNG
jgi:two-component system sensor histidine kinase/response regulator